MIATQTPFRMSFFGGGTDYKSFFEKYGGSVLSTTVDKYVYVTLRHLPPFFDHHTILRYSKTESVRKTEDIEHPLVKNCMMFMNMHNLSIYYDADLPARSGLGSSSAFAVGLLQAMYAMQGKYADKHRLAAEAIYVERELCNEAGGWQDQIAVAYGGFNRIDFDMNGFSVKPVIMSLERKKNLNGHLLMLYTGISRLSARVAATQVSATKDKSAELLEMKKLVDEAEKILVSSRDITEFGKLLDYTWQLKRCLTTDISTDYIDEIYKTAKENGAIGGKIMGAGGGGFMILFAAPDCHKRIRNALSNFVSVPFLFENEGSKIFHYEPENF